MAHRLSSEGIRLHARLHRHQRFLVWAAHSRRTGQEAECQMSHQWLPLKNFIGPEIVHQEFCWHCHAHCGVQDLSADGDGSVYIQVQLTCTTEPGGIWRAAAGACQPVSTSTGCCEGVSGDGGGDGCTQLQVSLHHVPAHQTQRLQKHCHWG